ncbi:MAG TPA: cytochrome c [Xanthobacteraceae bacterium]|jgi:mono/diheme cytochrome c family protein|nr:cytochrome c [Xanthobacteraceae bacterium]
MKRVLKRLLGLMVATCTVTFCMSGFDLPAQAQDAPAGDAANGQRIYLADGCFTCHGRSGQGGNYYGTTPTLAKTELPFEGFKQQLRDPVRVMPPYTQTVVSDKEAADIYAFLQTLSGRRPAKDFPILNN